MMKLRLPLAVVAAVLVFAAHAQSTTYYRWKDATGATQYGSVPPPGARAEQVTVNGGHAVPPTASKAVTPVAQPAGALAAADASARTRNCEAAKHNQEIVGGSSMLVDSSDPANAKRLSAEQLEAARAAAKKDVATYCTAGAQ